MLRRLWDWLTGKQRRFDRLTLEFRVKWLKELLDQERQWSVYLESRLHYEFRYGKALEEEIRAAATGLGFHEEAKMTKTSMRMMMFRM